MEAVSQRPPEEDHPHHQTKRRRVTPEKSGNQGRRVEEILGLRRINGKLAFYVKWEGSETFTFLSSELATKHIPNMVLQFYHRHLMLSHNYEKVGTVGEAEPKNQVPKFAGKECHQCHLNNSKDSKRCTMEILCNKVYCFECLKSYEDGPPKDLKELEGEMHWICPACRNVCTCLSCQEKRKS